MAGDLPREIVKLSEERAKRKEEAKKKKIEQAILKRVMAMTREASRLENAIRELEQKIDMLKSQGKSFSLRIAEWSLARKKKRLVKLKEVTPAINS